MNKFRVLLLPLFLTSIFYLAGCEKITDPAKGSPGEEDPTDYDWDTTQVVMITLNSRSISVVPDVADVSGSTVTITDAGTYKISGSLSDGQLIVDSEDEAAVKLILDGASIRCSNSAPLYVKHAEKVIVILNEESENYLYDGTSYAVTDGEPNAALFSNSYLAISGTGLLAVTANYKDGISGDDGLVINSGTITVTSADDGIRGKDFLYIRDGAIAVNSKGDGLKSDNTEDPSLGYILIDTGTLNISATAGDGINASGVLTINEGSFNITTGGGAGTISSGSQGRPGMPGGSSGGYSGTISEKALKAAGDLSIAKGNFIINSADDAIHSNLSVTIDDGTYSMASGDDAVHSDGPLTINGGTMVVTSCYEGLESPSITLNGGNLDLSSVDDTFNATRGSATESNDGSSLNITGGNIVANASKGDCIDSNGNVTMTGGTLVAHGPASSPEVGADVNGTFNVSGGFLVFTGPNSGNMIETISSSSSQQCIKATFSRALSTSTLFHIEDQDGNYILTFMPVRSVYYIVVCSPGFINGRSYSLYTGGSTTGTYSNGLYTGGIYSGGTLKKSVTLSGIITNVSL